ncbi:MAG: hypothetical protein H6993_09385 [Pseudomonadales bacterium]|nr:hypothetical protein [Pseudomonadales bacterium]
MAEHGRLSDTFDAYVDSPMANDRGGTIGPRGITNRKNGLRARGRYGDVLKAIEVVRQRTWLPPTG